MKKCEVCQNEFDDLLESCPYCSTKSENLVNDDLSTNSGVGISVTKVVEMDSTADDYSKSKVFCKYCGNEIVNNKDYCSHCGRDIYDEEKKHCTNCGKVLEEKQTFCDKCGQKVTAIVVPKAVPEVKNKFSKKKMLIATITLFALVGIVIAGVKLVPKLFVTYDEYMAEGDYEKAYEKAGENEKKLVLKENIAANVSGLTKEMLKDPSSFALREVYLEDAFGLKLVVLKQQGNNSYGASVSGYVLYGWDEEDAEFFYYGSCNDFEEEEPNSWDDADDKREKKRKNTVKSIVKNVVSKKQLKMETSTVDRINGLNRTGKLGDIKLLDEAKAILNKK